MKKVATVISIAVVWVCLLIPGYTVAQGLRPGFRLGVYTDVGDLFIGGELLIPVRDRIYFNPNVEYVFVENGSYITFNGDFHYDFSIEGSPLFFWLGAGLAILYFDHGKNWDADADVGANLLFGLGMSTSSQLVPYVQGKIILSDNSEFALGFGVRF